MRTLLRILLDLPRPYTEDRSQPIRWTTWGKRRAAFFSWPTTAVLYLLGVVARVNVVALIKGWRMDE